MGTVPGFYDANHSIFMARKHPDFCGANRHSFITRKHLGQPPMDLGTVPRLL